MAMVSTCPFCNKRYELDAVLTGRKVQCRDCRQTFWASDGIGKKVALNPEAGPKRPAEASSREPASGVSQSPSPVSATNLKPSRRPVPVDVAASLPGKPAAFPANAPPALSSPGDSDAAGRHARPKGHKVEHRPKAGSSRANPVGEELEPNDLGLNAGVAGMDADGLGDPSAWDASAHALNRGTVRSPVSGYAGNPWQSLEKARSRSGSKPGVQSANAGRFGQRQSLKVELIPLVAAVAIELFVAGCVLMFAPVFGAGLPFITLMGPFMFLLAGGLILAGCGVAFLATDVDTSVKLKVLAVPMAFGGLGLVLTLVTLPGYFSGRTGKQAAQNSGSILSTNPSRPPVYSAEEARARQAEAKKQNEMLTSGSLRSLENRQQKSEQEREQAETTLNGANRRDQAQPSSPNPFEVDEGEDAESSSADSGRPGPSPGIPQLPSSGPFRGREKPGFPATSADLLPGTPVWILWGSSWWPGEVLEIQEGAFLIHYDGHSAAWDEPKTTEELRLKTAPADQARNDWRSRGVELVRQA